MTSSLLDRLVPWWSSWSVAAQNRLVGAALVASTGPVLALAMWLDPDPAGVGTHRQLGLGGCTVLTLTGWPCPMCGMTTTFTHMAHADPIGAVVTQPFGVVLFLVTLALFVTGLGGVFGTSWWRRGLDVVLAYEVPIAAGTLIGMAAGWVYKCVAMGLIG